MENKKVSFDFDNTLTRKEVQRYCKELIKKGVEVFVTTFRYNQLLKHLYPEKPHNIDLYEVTDRLGIPRENITFTNNRNKSEVLNGSGCIFHIDDEYSAINDVHYNTDVHSIDVRKSNWRLMCETALDGLYLKEFHGN